MNPIDPYADDEKYDWWNQRRVESLKHLDRLISDVKQMQSELPSAIKPVPNKVTKSKHPSLWANA